MQTGKKDISGGPFLGHSANADGAGVPELLHDHLRRVAERTSRFSAAFGAAEQGYAAGLLHDLGKYAKRFQDRLRDPSHVHGCDHWTVGALAAAQIMKRHGIVPAVAIAGHHIGLGGSGLGLFETPKDIQQRLSDIMRAHSQESPDYDILQLAKDFMADGMELPLVTEGLAPAIKYAADMLDVRMFFSALVDADFLETEAHFAGTAQKPYCPRADGPAIDLDRAIASLDSFLAAVRKDYRDSPMSPARDRLRRDCLAAAARPQGLFTISAPTGTGKTLAMLAFALHHARTHNLRRIIVVMPFLNILDQTATEYRAIFGEQNGFERHTVLEHHSLADHRDNLSEDGVDEAARESDGKTPPRLLAENWDAPVILTTNVQFLESLMADRPSRCRKLHRLAKSVILCDEVQTLPSELAVATLATLSRLSDPSGPYGSTVVFSTATQPALDAFSKRIVPDFASRGWQPTEIVTDVPSLYRNVAGRVNVHWRYNAAISLDDIASELHTREQVLCIVNLKRHAASLIASLRDRGMSERTGLLHLSTNMCPAHREEALRAVRSRLKHGQSIHLVATQCVEAGVDLDFPVVYRALAPLEAIAQAAGRCNRHGRGPRGQVVVFKPQDDRKPYPPGYSEAVDATEGFLNGLALQTDLDATEILGDPTRLSDYYRRFYRLTGKDSTESDRERLLMDAIRGGDFAEAASRYRLIQDDSIRVLVPYDPVAFERLRDEIENSERFAPNIIRDWMRRASPHAVNLFRPKDSDPIAAYLQPIQFSRRRTVEAWEADWCFALPDVKYDPLLGISTEVENLWIV
jgi:CRISPR-associated helicase Cas3/CRISPR-associated endonuclease Cas3-HD